MNILAEDLSPVNTGVHQSMISTKSGRDYHVIQMFSHAPYFGRTEQETSGKRITEYDYLDENGDLAYQIVREDLPEGGKDFKQRHPDGSGAWLWSIKGLPQIPYNLPRVKQVIQSGGLVFIVEGEKCADTLNAALKALNLRAVATCNNGGATHWTEQQSKYLTGANVALLPDNDERGRAHVERAARHLLGLATSIKRLDLPNLPDKGDIADWLSGGRSVADLQSLYRAAVEYTPPADPEPAPKPSKPIRHIGQTDRPRLRAWAQAALEGETNGLARLIDGRFQALTSAANRLGTIATHGLLTETECLSSLMWALEQNGYVGKAGHKTAEYRARFYFRSGLGDPCKLPEADELPSLEIKKTKAPETFIAYVPADAPTVWDHGVPVAVRGLMNAYQGTGPLLELVIEGKNTNLIPDDQFITVECLCFVSKRLGRGLTEGVIRHMIRAATDPLGVQFLRIRLHNTDHSVPENYGRLTDLSAPIRRNPCGCVGRDPEHYEFLPVETILSNLAEFIHAPLIQQVFSADKALIAPIRLEFIAALSQPASVYDELVGKWSEFIEEQPGFKEAMEQVRRDHRQMMYRLRNPQSAPIPAGQTYRNVSDYKAACAYALVYSHGGKSQYGRKLLAALIGCADGRLKSVLDRAGIAMEKNQYFHRHIKDSGELRLVRFAYDKRYKGFPRLIKSSGQDKPIRFGRRNMLDWVEAELAVGHTVELLYHQANLQVIKRIPRWLIDFVCHFLELLTKLVKAMTVPADPQQQDLFAEPETGQAAPEPAEPEPKPKREKKPKKARPDTWHERWIKFFAGEFTGQEVGDVEKAFNALLKHRVVPDPETQAYRRVVDFRTVKDHWDPQTQSWDSPDYVYIGRANFQSGLPESPWANQYKIGEHGTRKDVIDLYEIDLMESPILLKQIKDLRGKTLVCWCAPDTCHGDVLARYADLSDKEIKAMYKDALRHKVEADDLLSWIESELGGTVTGVEQTELPPVFSKAA